MAKSRLGRGLEALIPVDGNETERKETVAVPLRLIDPNPYQPRREFAEEKLQELAASIRLHGILQPVVLRRRGTRYELVAGERRCRAAELAEMTEVPAIVREFSDGDMMELAIVENLQRENLSPIEEALGFDQLMQQLNMTQTEVAERIGKSRPYVANTLRLLQLPPLLQEYVSRGTLSAGHGRALLGLEDAQEQMVLAEIIMQEGWSVRQTEKYVKQKQTGKANVSRETQRETKVAPEVSDLERQLSTSLGVPVRLVPGRKSNKIEITFYDQEDLERLLEFLLG